MPHFVSDDLMVSCCYTSLKCACCQWVADKIIFYNLGLRFANLYFYIFYSITVLYIYIYIYKDRVRLIPNNISSKIIFILIKVTHRNISTIFNRQLSIIYLFVITRLRLTWEWIKNHLYMVKVPFKVSRWKSIIY